ncbi:hypothetical protein CTA2_11331, partial [Colletotrichum tanaceti]
SPVYDALSYLWVDAQITRGIFVQGTAHRVTANLEVALRHLRRVDGPRALWIDALCINQDDIPERSSLLTDDSDLAFDLTEAGMRIASIVLVPRPHVGQRSSTTAIVLWPDAEEGDRIAVIDGVRVLYILRVSEREPGSWCLVGDAYVHGIMDGEGVTPGERCEILPI